MHLWDAEHSYYCTEGNYFRRDDSTTRTVWEFKSWGEFITEMGEADKDYNFLFRWDWTEDDPETGESTYKGDDYYRNGKLYLFFMLQRKGYHSTSIVDVCRADEPAVIEYLNDQWAHMRKMWEPLTSNV